VAAIAYTLRKGREAGGLLRLYRRLRTRNACKTCAFSMGGQRGGMVNEAGGFPEVCKKSIQAQVGDIQGPISESFFKQHEETWTLPRERRRSSRSPYGSSAEKGA